MTKQLTKIDKLQELASGDELNIEITPKSRKEYMRDQKISLINRIGVAQAALLLQKTPKHEVKHRSIGSKQIDYVEHAYVSETLNFATLLDWDLIVDRTERISEEVIVEGHLIVRFSNGVTVTKYGTGGAKRIANNANQTWGDVYNSATSKMLKVCAARLGLGLDLYRHEEAQEEVVVKSKPTGYQTQTDDNEPATENQIEALIQLGITFPDEPITKGQARKAIMEATQK